MAKQYMPLEDCSGSAVLGGDIPQLRPPAFSDAPKYTTFSYTYYPGVSEIYEAVAPNISTRFYAIEAAIDFSKAKGDLQAVLMAHGGYFGEHSFYIYQGKLCYVYNWLGQPQKIACDLPRLSGEVTLKVEFAKPKIIAPSDEKLGDSTIYEMKLYINNIEQNVDIIRTFSNHTLNFLIPYKHEIPCEFQGAKLRRINVTITNDVSGINDDQL
ncbi:MAG: hypothetical protein GPJ06_13480 [Microcystis aeruginosa G13-11]|nr:hypothetical protein [Microcystis aeruginosa G13-11]